MKIIPLGALLCYLSLSLNSPSQPTASDSCFLQSAGDGDSDDRKIFTIVDVMPEFPGGQVALQRFLLENIRYPAIARENELECTVYVRFVVWCDGTVRDATIQRGCPTFNEEVLRVINLMPTWKPGRQGGRHVPVYFSMPVVFELSDAKPPKPLPRDKDGSRKLLRQ
jgi:TonB family protein